MTTNIPTLKEFKCFKNLNRFTFKPIGESFHDDLTLHTFENNIQVLFSKTPLTKDFQEILKSKEKDDECFIIQKSKNNKYFVLGIIQLD